MKSRLLAALTASLLVVTPAIAAGPAATTAPLSAGKAAGTREAALRGGISPFVWAGLVAIAIGAAIVALDNSDNSTATGTGSGAP